MKRVLGWVLGALLIFTGTVEAHKKKCAAQEKIYVQIDHLEINERGMFYLDPITGVMWELSSLHVDAEGYYGIVPWPVRIEPWVCPNCGTLNKSTTPRLGCIRCPYVEPRR